MATFVIRPASKSDCRIIAEYNRISSDGVCDYIWQKLAGSSDDDLLDIGQQRFEREDADISYRNASVVEDGGEVVGMMLAYKMLVDTDHVESDPVLRPYNILEEDRSYYIASMAIQESHRGRGIGGRLLALAEAQALEKGLTRMSLNVLENNADALRFYECNGYSITAREAIVPHPMIGHDGDALLMVKQLNS
jgi:ribosomal protein S18 acetylase RimI-like enzyme